MMKKQEAIKSWLSAKQKKKQAVREKNRAIGKKKRKKYLPKFRWQITCYPDFVLCDYNIFFDKKIDFFFSHKEEEKIWEKKEKFRKRNCKGKRKWKDIR